MAFGGADAVFGADGAAEFRHPPQHPVIHPVVIGGRPGDVDVDVAVAHVAEQPGPGGGIDAGHQRRHLFHKVGQRSGRQRHVQLVGWTQGVDRLGVGLPVSPELGSSGRPGGHHGVSQPRHRGGGVGQVGGGFPPVGHLDQQDHRVAIGEGVGQTGDGAHQLEAGLQHQLAGVEGGKRPAEDDGGGHGVGRRVEGQQGGGPFGGGWHQPEAGGGDDGQGPLAAAQQAGQVVAGGVLDQPAEVGDHRPGAEDGLHSQQLGPGVAVPEDVDAAGVSGHGAADGGRLAAGQVHPVGPAGGIGGGLQIGQGDAGPGGDLTGRLVHRPEVIEPPEAEHHLAVEGNTATHQPGVSALGNQGDAVPTADIDHPGHLGGGGRPDHGAGGAFEPPGPVGGERRHDLGIEDQSGADHLAELVDRCPVGGERTDGHRVAPAGTVPPGVRAFDRVIRSRSRRSTLRSSPPP